jgi:hypothetical protein
MTVDWAAVSAVAEVIGVVVVVVSLVFVGLQVRQNTRAIETNSRQGILDADLALISGYITHSVDPHLIGDDVKLSPEDERRFVWMLIKAIRIREFAWQQYRAGMLDEESWLSYMAPVAGMFSTARGKVVLDFYTGNPAFMKVLNDAVATGRVTSLARADATTAAAT